LALEVIKSKATLHMPNPTRKIMLPFVIFVVALVCCFSLFYAMYIFVCAAYVA